MNEKAASFFLVTDASTSIFPAFRIVSGEVINFESMQSSTSSKKRLIKNMYNNIPPCFAYNIIFTYSSKGDRISKSEELHFSDLLIKIYARSYWTEQRKTEELKITVS